MSQNVQGPTPGGGAPQGPTPSQPPAQFPSSGGQGGALDVWSQMFGGSADIKQVQAFMNGVIMDSIHQCQKEQEKAVEAIKKLRQQEKGEE